MSAPVGGAAAPAATVAADRPTDQEVIALLRAQVPKFRDLPEQQRLLSADLKLELQRHKGGAACLPEKFRRKVPAGHEHLIVNAPSLKVLYEAWHTFMTGGGFDAGSVYSEQELTLQTVTRAPAAAGASAQGGAAGAGGPDEPPTWPDRGEWMVILWMRHAWSELTRWREVSAPGALVLDRHQRRATVGGGLFPDTGSASDDGAATTMPQDAASFRADVELLLQQAVDMLFCKHPVPQLWNCTPSMLVDALPKEFEHFGQLGAHATSCGEDCGAGGAARSCLQPALDLAGERLHRRRVEILCGQYEAAAHDLNLDKFATAADGAPRLFWSRLFAWFGAPADFRTSLHEMHVRVASDLGLKEQQPQFHQHFFCTLGHEDLDKVREAVLRGIGGQRPPGVPSFGKRPIEEGGAGAGGGGSARKMPKLTRSTHERLVERAKLAIEKELTDETGLRRRAPKKTDLTNRGLFQRLWEWIPLPHARWKPLLRQGQQRLGFAAGEDSESESSGGEGAQEDDGVEDDEMVDEIDEEMEDADGAQDEEGSDEMEDVGWDTNGAPN